MESNNLSTRAGVKDLVKGKFGVISMVGMYYAMVCAGAYGIEEMIPECGPGLTIVLLLVMPLIWALPYSFILAEIGSARPVEGGASMWVKEALGEFWFAIIIFSNVVWALVCNTVYVVLSVSYLGSMIELTETESFLVSVLMVLIFFTINVIGLKEVSIVSTVLSILILIAFASVAIVGFMNMNVSPVEPFLSGEYDTTFQTVGAGFAIAIWMYSGFDEMAVVAGEVKDSHKMIPKALMIVIPIICLTYLLPTLASLGSIGRWDEWTTEAGGIGYATVLTEHAGPIFGILFMIIAIIGQCAIFNVCLVTGSRLVLVMADEHFGPKFLTKLTKKRGTPFVGLIIIAVATILLVPLDFTFLVVIDIFFMVIVVSLTVTAAFILKRRIPPEEVPFKAPGGIVGHTIMCTSVLTVCVLSTLLNGTDWYLGGLLWILIIPIIYVIAKWTLKGISVREPELYPINPKTKLGYGDVGKIGALYMSIGVFAILSRYFLYWYESSWAYPYYKFTYQSGLFSDFDLMLNTISMVGLGTVVFGLICILASKKLDKR